jgi:ATP-binding cassette subfamily C (CFTR/MRP) protein 1
VRQTAKCPGAGGLVILDEATSRTDKKMNFIIQAVIRKRFDKCTLLVLENGRVAEVGRPDALRMQVHGLFRSMLRNVEMQDVPRTIV